VRILKLQSDKILKQQKDIERQQQRFSDQIESYEFQKMQVYLLSGGILIIFGLAVYLYYSKRENQRINKELGLKNEEVLSQQNEIIKYAKEAEEANAARFKFFTNISHEFRTPITLILGPVEELLKLSKPLPPKLKADLELVQKNSYRLLRLINQLIEFRRLENGKLKVRANENDVVKFISEVVLAFRTLAEEKGINLDFLHTEIKEKIWFDVSMLDKVIFNLLSNSFKFTPKGGSIRVQLKEEDERIRIIVDDNGKGMSKEHVEHAFDRFYQGDDRTSKGSGLGLSLAKELIDIHKGSITLKSEKGLGTRFDISLLKGNDHFSEEEIIEEWNPYEISGKEYVKQLSEISFVDSGESKSDQKILIVEDDSDLLLFIGNYLSDYYDVITCDDGDKAILLAQEEIPDLVITDVLLGETDGFKLTRRIKSDIRTSHIPVIILTAKTDDESKVQGMKSGADQYITKPFKAEYLLESVKTHLKNRELLKRHFNVNEEADEALEKFPIDLDKSFIEKFKKVVNENMHESGVNVDFLCRELGMSRVQLYRKVKALIGKSVNDYINDTRLTHARKLLSSDLSIAEVAYQSGFSSPAYFSTAFKAKFKISPSDYKTTAKAAN